ncbi:YqaJ viral recombinase family protein [Brevibacterium sp. SMBL_HHYL_HB1]|uniref:YqaJ viral recombinase family protein n=1 Tax=Brevibacterium sp. SMBL_HHYL_HB1 TaxID=2777556 RepID=UPI001BABDAD5|nr:YqaJ viral recombinase family protein [Brevibacterium sp. SMBL_HHYL_HB1]QUL79892.1 YqaJ viral recombinase family protein [Brevibacterium sp. SMBL_HHYL_HB1]
MKFEIGPSSEAREAWMGFRGGKVTATDVAKLAGSGLKGWQTLRAEKDSGESSFHGNKYTKHGSAREATISDQLDVMLGMTHNTNVLVSVEDDRFVSTPDLIDREGNRVGDIKTAKWDGEKWDTVPQDYFDQLQWQMFTTGAESAVLAVEYHEDFVPVFMDPHLFYVDRDEQRIEFLRYLADRFTHLGELTELDEWMIERSKHVQVIKPEQEAIDAIDQKIRDFIGDRPYFKHVNPAAGAINWFTPKPSRTFDKKAVLTKIAADRGIEPTPKNLKAIEGEFLKTGAKPKPKLTITTPGDSE